MDNIKNQSCFQNGTSVLSGNNAGGTDISCYNIDDKIAALQNELEMLEKAKTRDAILSQYNIKQQKDGRWYVRVRDETKKDKRRKIIKKNREDLESALILMHFEEQKKEEDAHWEQMSTLSIHDVWLMCVEEMQENPSIKQQTIERYQNDYDKYFFQEMREAVAAKVTAKDWARFLEKNAFQFDMRYSAYRNLRILVWKIIKKINSDIVRDGEEISRTLVNDCCVVDVQRLQKHSIAPEQNIYMPDEWNKLRDYLVNNPSDGLYNRIILLMLISGIRIGEAVALRTCDIEHDRIYIRKQEEHRKKPGGGKIVEVVDAPKTDAGYRYIPLPTGWEWLVDELKANATEDGYLAKNSQGKRANEDVVSKRMDRICAKLKIPEKRAHRLRKTYVTMLADQVDESTLARIVGHSCVRTTKRYYDFSEINLQKARNQISNAMILNG